MAVVTLTGRPATYISGAQPSHLSRHCFVLLEAPPVMLVFKFRQHKLDHVCAHLQASLQQFETHQDLHPDPCYFNQPNANVSFEKNIRMKEKLNLCRLGQGMKVFESINTMYSERSAVVLYILVFKIRNLSILLSSIKHNERVPFNIITGTIFFFACNRLKNGYKSPPPMSI